MPSSHEGGVPANLTQESKKLAFKDIQICTAVFLLPKVFCVQRRKFVNDASLTLWTIFSCTILMVIFQNVVVSAILK